MTLKGLSFEPTKTEDAPLMLQSGSGLTVRITSSLRMWLAQVLLSVTVKRKVAVAEAPLSVTVVVREPGSAIDALPETTIQFVLVIGEVPGWADPAIVKVVEAPSVQLV